jgi:hypothetical protein
MFEPKNIDSCFETVIVAMSAYISQLKDEIDYQQRENERLRTELDGYRYRGQTAEGSVLHHAGKHDIAPAASGTKITPEEWAKAFDIVPADISNLDSDRDPFEGGGGDV